MAINPKNEAISTDKKAWSTVDPASKPDAQDLLFIEKAQEARHWLAKNGLPDMDKSRIDKMLVTKLDSE